MITEDKITEIFCATDEFSKEFDVEIENMPLLSSEGKARRRRAASMSDSEIMTILIMFHFGTFDNFKHYYLHFIKIHLKRDFPDAVSYNRFVELESRVFFKMGIHLTQLVRCALCRRGTSGDWNQKQHEEQTDATVGQDYAQKKVYHQVH